MTYEAYVLTAGARRELLEAFPPKYDEVVAHHVTEKFGVPKNPNGFYGQMSTNVRVVGYAHEDGIEAVVVTVDGQAFRPDGKRYHVTLSLDREKGWTPAKSNIVISRGFLKVDGLALTATFEYL